MVQADRGRHRHDAGEPQSRGGGRERRMDGYVSHVRKGRARRGLRGDRRHVREGRVRREGARGALSQAPQECGRGQGVRQGRRSVLAVPQLRRDRQGERGARGMPRLRAPAVVLPGQARKLLKIFGNCLQFPRDYATMVVR